MGSPLLARGVPPGWYRGWTGTSHYFVDPSAGLTACGVTVSSAPWPSDWGDPKQAKKSRCWLCERAVRDFLGVRR